MLLLAIPGVLLGLACWLWFRDNPRQHPWVNDAEREEIEAGEPRAAPGARMRLDLTGWNGVHGGLLMLAGLASTFADQFYVLWIPSFLNERGMSDTQMGMFAMLPLLGGTIGAPVGGFLNDFGLRVMGNRRLVRSAVAVAGKGLAGGLTVAIIFVADPALAALVLFAVKFFTDWSLASQWGATTDMGGRGAGTLFGAVNTAGTVGAASAALAMGYTKEHAGWEGLFALVAGVYVVTALCWAFIDCTRRLVVEEAPPQ
jgi:hypothetical protein